MKHLIITAHPHPTSFTYALSNAYADELVKMGHECDCRDLYAMNFNPILQPSEIDGHPQPDAQIEQEHIKDADATAFFYPLWWASMPAILKGYIDRVFTHGVAYRFEGNVMRGLLRGRTNLLVTISAAPRRVMQEAGEWDAIRAIQDNHIFHSVGLTLADHIHIGEVVPGMSATVARAHLETIRAAAHRHFPPGRPRAA